MTDITGWPLDDAREALQSEAPDCRVVTIETGPPAHRLRNGDSQLQEELASGSWRVLRWNVHESQTVELIIAREQVSEARRRPRREDVS